MSFLTKLNPVNVLKAPKNAGLDPVSALKIPNKYGLDPKSALSIPNKYGLDPKSALTLPNKYGLDPKSALSPEKIGHALSDDKSAPTAINSPGSLGSPFASQIQQNLPQPSNYSQKAFAPQMQMPMNQGLPQRVQSGMQFGSAPNPVQPPQNMQVRPQMPVFNSGPQPQYGQQNLNQNSNQNAMGIPPQYQQFNQPAQPQQPQMMPNRVDGIPMNRAMPTNSTAPTIQQQQMVSGAYPMNRGIIR